MKYITYKYTAKLSKDSKPETFYVEALNETLARQGLAEMLNVNPEILRLSTNNLPFKVRQALRDKNNTEYTICLKVNKRPATTEVDTLDVFTGKNIERQVTTMKFKINDLLKGNEELLSKYNTREEAYIAIRKEITNNEELSKYEVLESVTLLDQLDGGYLLNQSNANNDAQR
jgi:hypothetical protein